MNASEQDFVIKVMNRIPEIKMENDPDFISKIKYLYRRGFTVDDAVAYCQCFEEVNPELSEDVALKRMNVLIDKYKLA